MKRTFLTVLLMLIAVFSAFSAPAQNETPATAGNFIKVTNKAGLPPTSKSPLAKPEQVFELTPDVYSFFKIGFTLNSALNPAMPPANLKSYRLEADPANPEKYMSSASQKLYVWYMIKSRNHFRITLKGADLRSDRTDNKLYFKTETKVDGLSVISGSDTTGKYNEIVLLSESGLLENDTRQAVFPLNITATLIRPKEPSGAQPTLIGERYKGTFVVNITTLDVAQQGGGGGQ